MDDMGREEVYAFARLMCRDEDARRVLSERVNANSGERPALEAEHGKVWDTNQLRDEFEVIGFMAPMVSVKRRSDGKDGTLFFQHSPRFYFGFTG
jgi:hypothetical protein